MKAPLIVLAFMPVAILIQRVLFRSGLLSFWMSIVGYCCGGALLFFAPAERTLLFGIDSFGRFYGMLNIAASLVIAIFSRAYLRRERGEYYVFLGLATLGSVSMTLATHFVSFFLGLEILTISLYALIAYKKNSAVGVEGALKYLILAGLSSAFLLFGLAMLYFETGSLMGGQFLLSRAVLVALAMVFVGVGFKLALVPFYLWTPDVYQGAPAPVTAFIATVSKGSVLVFFSRFLAGAGLLSLPILSAMAIVSMIVGSLLALFQENLKRLLAYSSIAHLGYLLVAVIADRAWGRGAMEMYMTAYYVATLGVFGVLCLFSAREDEDMERLSLYRGLAWSHPFYATVLILMIVSLAGLPLTMGFMGKFYILRAAVSSGLWLPAVVLVLTSVLGLFYYLRVIGMLFARGGEPFPIARSVAGWITLMCLTILLLYLGVYPNALLVNRLCMGGS